MNADLIERYLDRHANVEQLPRLTRRYRYVLCIPAFAEPATFLDTVFSLASREAVLTIVIVNVPDDAKPDAIALTRILAQTLSGYPDVLVLDRIDEPIPRRQGVGLARKVGADLACALINDGHIECPLIFMTDADVVLPASYFDAGSEYAERGTVLFPFHHLALPAADVRLQEAAVVYELHLRHYVLGLREAGSAYAHQSIGSTLAIHAETYAAVRGVPRRNAGEDFYLLNKAAKVDRIASLKTPSIRIAARDSTRVPFGTGPALKNMPTDLEQFLSYPPAAFEELAVLLEALQRWSRGEGLNLPAEQLDWLMEQGWNAGPFEAQHPAGVRRWRASQEWFDGFRTMRFLRARQRALPDAALLDTLRAHWQAPAATPTELLEILKRHEMDPLSTAPRFFTGVPEAVKMSVPERL